MWTVGPLSHTNKWLWVPPRRPSGPGWPTPPPTAPQAATEKENGGSSVAPQSLRCREKAMLGKRCLVVLHTSCLRKRRPGNVWPPFHSGRNGLGTGVQGRSLLRAPGRGGPRILAKEWSWVRGRCGDPEGRPGLALPLTAYTALGKLLTVSGGPMGNGGTPQCFLGNSNDLKKQCVAHSRCSINAHSHL